MCKCVCIYNFRNIFVFNHFVYIICWIIALIWSTLKMLYINFSLRFHFRSIISFNNFSLFSFLFIITICCHFCEYLYIYFVVAVALLSLTIITFIRFLFFLFFFIYVLYQYDLNIIYNLIYIYMMWMSYVGGNIFFFIIFIIHKIHYMIR